MHKVVIGCDYSPANVPLPFFWLVAHRLPHQTPKPVLTVYLHCYGEFPADVTHQNQTVLVLEAISSTCSLNSAFFWM